MVGNKTRHRTQSKLASHALQINVAQLLKEPSGARRTYEIDGVALPQLDAGLQISSLLNGEVRLQRIGVGILVTGQFVCSRLMDCNRCLTPIEVPVSFKLEEEFRPTLDIINGTVLPQEPDFEKENLINEQHILDLIEVIRQELWLAGPSSPLCRPDCEGFCDQCGQNLKDGNCDCEVEETDVRWAGLQTLKLDD
jgi:uncharacterized protein